MTRKPAIYAAVLTAMVACLASCSTLRRGSDAVVKGTGSALGAVAGAGSSVVKGTAALGRGTAEVVTSPWSGGPELVEMQVSVNNREGTIIIALDDKAAPKHAENFRKLVKKGYYNGLAFHRAVPKYLVQTGDPRSKHENARAVWGLGGPGYTLDPEIGLRHTRGAVGMARLGDRLNPTRRSNGSQFYIALASLPELDGNYTVFGRVIEGLEIADAIGKVAVDENDAPVKPVKVLSVRLIEGKAPPAPAQTLVTKPTPRADDPAPEPAAAAPARRSKPRPEPEPAAPPKKKGWFGRTMDAIW